MSIFVSTEPASIIFINQVYNEDLTGPINGVNKIFTTSEKFMNTGGMIIRVHLNSVRLFFTDDYTLSESGGPGSGYDTVTLVNAPKSSDRVTADYYRMM